ncbi:hypothetical protein [Thermodesulfatator autotrophicus]|uniref:hypothetical protein n=1 Tax=Thermodesulfatator autotrophicus TaxID=1795632 RepID=UPI0012F86351|nr:hypothetical protein [Thermodesulfatator autotrophicus]
MARNDKGKTRNDSPKIVTCFVLSLLIFLTIISPLKAQGLEEGVKIEGKVLMTFPCPKSAIVLFFDENNRSKRIKIFFNENHLRLYPGDVIKFRLFKTFDGQFLARDLIIKERKDFTGIRKRLQKSIRQKWPRCYRKEFYKREQRQQKERGGGHGGGYGR